jgi:hypothetical protein
MIRRRPVLVAVAPAVLTPEQRAALAKPPISAGGPR